MEVPGNEIGDCRADLTKIGVIAPASDVSDNKVFLLHQAADHLLGHSASKASQGGEKGEGK